MPRFVAEQLERVAQIIVFTGAETPEQYDDRVFANEEAVQGAALRARLPGGSGIRPSLSEPVHQLARPIRIPPARPARPGRVGPDPIRRSHMKKHKKLTKAEAGRIGGMTTKKRHGIEHYRAIGKQGLSGTCDRHWQGDKVGHGR